ncbi:DNA-formamidopyrimidine glycosylase [Floccifex sp.]|uniref:DNA-formamidopyrimidine glycosylase n=1 Tax=Floccifex sp. TaxID=2815810 RepID=UPI002A755D97|nr:DNA-formamidopyrimidine glycosylase [Floccifex sp.]MDY2957584.1 DNA-formamidopyrimidine glycosylase [Floccifex sp.]
MPEAPEVQTVISTLASQIKDSTIVDVTVYYDKILETEDFVNKIKGQSFLSFSRIGKYLIFTTEKYDFVVHLRMEGKFYIMDTFPKDLKHIHVIFHLDDGRYLCYHDTRKFGRMALYDKVDNKYDCPALKNVGWDVLDDRFNAMYFYNKIHKSNRNLKTALLDQSIQAGIGNIYADEICFMSRLDPRSRCSRLSKKDCEKIVEMTKYIIKGAIKAGGTTIRSYTSSLGVTGLFQLQLHVHTKKDEPCEICHNKIIKTVIASRGTYICTHCQKRK